MDANPTKKPTKTLTKRPTKLMRAQVRARLLAAVELDLHGVVGRLTRPERTWLARWLLKSEPDVFSYDDLVRAKREGWDGIRSYKARNFPREMLQGEQAIFYHSNAKPPGVAGICKIVKTAEPDPTQFDSTTKYYDPASKSENPRWDWVTVAPVRRLPFVSHDELRT